MLIITCYLIFIVIAHRSYVSLLDDHCLSDDSDDILMHAALEVSNPIYKCVKLDPVCCKNPI